MSASEAIAALRRSFAGRMLLPAVSDKLGRKPVLYAVYIGLAAGSAWFAFAEAWWLLAAYALLTFFYSGGAAVQLDVECIEAELRDLGAAWATRTKPAHAIDD